MDALIGEFGWPNAEGYVVELEMGGGQYVELDVDVLFGFAALPFYGSPLPAGFFAAPPVPAPADLAGAAAAILHGLDDFENFDVDVLYGLAAMPFYGGALPAGFFVAAADAGLAFPAADLAIPAIHHDDVNLEALFGFAALPFYGADLPDDFIFRMDGRKYSWKLVASRKLGRRPPSTSEVYPPTPTDNVIAVEVPCGVRTGTRRNVRKLAQAQKSQYVSTPYGPGVYVWGSYGASSREF